jgi:glycosyltransferase involved in cell wall biosynthesis
MGEDRGREYERLGVIIVTHTADYLEECLRSVANQTVAPSATVLVDNASGTDEVHDIARRYRITTIRLDSPVTPSAARNIACSALADCDLVVNLDGDDIMKPRFLEVYWLTARDRQADVVFGAAELTGTATGVEFNRQKLGPKPDLRRGNYVPINSLFKWRLWREVGGFDRRSSGTRTGTSGYRSPSVARPSNRSTSLSGATAATTAAAWRPATPTSGPTRSR